MVFPNHFSSADEWPTPQKLFDVLHAEFNFSLDPCSTHTNHRCPRYYTKAEDGLTQDWRDHAVFVNPPVSQVSRWMRKAYAAARAGATVVCLVPVMTDSEWWHRCAMKGEIRFLRGGKLNLPFPFAIVVFRPPGHAMVPMEWDLSLPPIAEVPPVDEIPEATTGSMQPASAAQCQAMLFSGMAASLRPPAQGVVPPAGGTNDDYTPRVSTKHTSALEPSEAAPAAQQP